MSKKACITCPFNENVTKESHDAQYYGCLPSQFDIIKMKRETGNNWACHSNNKRVCQGLIDTNIERQLGLDMSSGKRIVEPTVNAPWVSWKEEDLATRFE
jgi:hypothetical protein